MPHQSRYAKLRLYSWYLIKLLQEKPKEKTIFSVKLEKIDAANKAKVIREVKAIMPNMNLVEACVLFLNGGFIKVNYRLGQKIRGVGSKDVKGKCAKGGGRKVDENTQRAGCDCFARIINFYTVYQYILRRRIYTIPFSEPQGKIVFLFSQIMLH